MKALVLSILLIPELIWAADLLADNEIKISSYIDISYNYLQYNNHFVSDVFDRAYDIEENGFTLQQAAVTFAKQPAQGWGGMANFTLGRDAYYTASYGINPKTGISRFGFDPTQLYVQYGFQQTMFMFGKFNSLAGVESNDPTQNTNFSRSIVAGYAEPGTHLGIRANYSANQAVNLIFGVNNGWDNIRDMSRGKTLELGASYTPNSVFSFATAGYYGDERLIEKVNTGPISRRTLIDLIATVNTTPQLSFIANYDYGMQTKATLSNGIIGKAVWQGLAGYVNYQFDDKWHSSLRAEQFYDLDGYRTGVAQKWRELTLTLGYQFNKHLDVRMETRHDYSSARAFIDKKNSNLGHQQQSYAVEAIYKL